MTTPLDLELIKAAAAGDLAGVGTLLERGANVNAEDDVRNSALNEAAHAGHAAVAERLLVAGADLEHKGGADLTPLMNAAVTGHVDVVRLLLSKGARVSNDLLSTIQLKVNILEENAESGMVYPEAAASWRKFMEFLVAERIFQDLPEIIASLASTDTARRIAALSQLAAAASYAVDFTPVLPSVRALTADADTRVRAKAGEVLQALENPPPEKHSQ
jgi:ankyrin repeat protein